jgi:drug/metabolite transporter (DMT)-like permease
MRWFANAQALIAAALFGLSPAACKRLGLDATPVLGSALLYGGAGATLALLVLARRGRAEAPLRRSDLPTLAAVIALGGLAAPILMLYGLARATGSEASLLLNLEMVFTVVVAVVGFGEHLSRHEAAAGLLIGAGAAWLTFRPGGAGAAHGVTGDLCIAAACLCWALDNNLTQRLSIRDPRRVVAAKGLGAATCALAIGLVTGAPAPHGAVIAAGLVVGALSYGTSLLLYVRALRELGAARTGALFATAPFVGAVVSVLVLGERVELPMIGAGVVMAAGVALFLRAQHAHEHVHDALEHEHMHTHDEHHQHAHRGDEGPEPHAHPHRHEPMRHSHAHVSDVHHRHKH